MDTADQAWATASAADVDTLDRAGLDEILVTMYATCAHPQCTIALSSCRIHHIDHWLRHDGPTDLDNLLPLCERHHHQIHDDNWTLRRQPRQQHRWIRPDRAPSPYTSTPNRRPHDVPTDGMHAML